MTMQDQELSPGGLSTASVPQRPPLQLLFKDDLYTQMCPQNEAEAWHDLAARYYLTDREVTRLKQLDHPIEYRFN